MDIYYHDEVNYIDLCTTTIDRAWTATNDCGLVTECLQIITVNDQTPPTIMCPEDVIIECAATSDPSATGEPTATDNCDTDLGFSFEDVLTTASNCESAIERTWSAIDNCGNTTTCSLTFVTKDTEGPVITVMVFAFKCSSRVLYIVLFIKI